MELTVVGDIAGASQAVFENTIVQGALQWNAVLTPVKRRLDLSVGDLCYRAGAGAVGGVGGRLDRCRGVTVGDVIVVNVIIGDVIVVNVIIVDVIIVDVIIVDVIIADVIIVDIVVDIVVDAIVTVIDVTIVIVAVGNWDLDLAVCDLPYSGVGGDY